jgi:hypothetical protein
MEKVNKKYQDETVKREEHVMRKKEEELLK